MSLDFYIDISEHAYKRSVPGSVYVHEKIVKAFGVDTLYDRLLLVVHSALGRAKPNDPGEVRNAAVKADLDAPGGTTAEVILTLSERQLSSTVGDRVILIDWDGEVLGYADKEDL